MRCAFIVLLPVCMASIIMGCAQQEGGGTADSYFSEGSSESATRAPMQAESAAVEEAESGDVASTREGGESSVEEASEVADRGDAEERSARREESDRQRRKKNRDRRPIQAGTLTAGSLDDHENLEEYLSYVSQAQQSDRRQMLPFLGWKERIVIQVQNGEGEGIGNARVTVQPAEGDVSSQETELFATRTGSDGQAFVLPGFDLPSESAEYLLTVEPGDGTAAIRRRVTKTQRPWKVVLPNHTAELPQQLDLALVIDTTGSMSDELDYLKEEIDNIAQVIHREFPNVSQRYALVLYRDEGDEYVTRTFDFTGSLSEFRNRLSAQHAAGGGDYPEAVHLALEQAGKLSWSQENAARVLFLVGDAPPHEQFIDRMMEGTRICRHEAVTMFPVAASGVNDLSEFLLRASAFLTGGQYLFLTDHSGVGNPHDEPHAPRYTVEPLNQLMVRLIAGELSGEAMLPREILATEDEDSSQAAMEGQVPFEEPGATSVESRREFGRLSAGGSHSGIVLEEVLESPVFRCTITLMAILGILFLDMRR